MALSRTVSGKILESGFAENPQHTIVIKPAARSVSVAAGDLVLADTDDAVDLFEGDYPPVLYFPRATMIENLFVRTDHRTWCPFKGEASYYSVRIRAGLIENAAWSYEDPFVETSAIKDYIAFYGSKVTISG